MRTYGRIPIEPGGKPVKWVVVETDENGLNDAVYLTTMLQVCKLNKQESPFYGNFGIAARASVTKQIFPDNDIWQIQQQFASFFASLVASKVPGQLDPTYNMNVTTNQGLKVPVQIST
jgi:hypothetical protein